MTVTGRAPDAGRAANLRGSLLMTAAMAGFAVEDMLVKTAARQMPLGQILLTIGLVGMAVFAVMARHQGEAPLPPAIWSRGMALRSLCEIAGRLFHALAIALIPLSVASAILQATPLVVVAGAAILFRERIGPRRWAAIGVGFAGVLLILRPWAAFGTDAGTDLAGLGPLALLAVAGMAGFAGRDLATRAAPVTLSNRQLGVVGFAMLAGAGAILLALSGGAHLPDAAGAALVGSATVVGVLAYHALTAAMRMGDVGAITPFRYTRLVFAMGLGVVVFAERPDPLTLAGSALIVVAGLAALGRGPQRRT